LRPRGAAKVIDLLKQAFEAEETAPYAGADGTIHHAEVRIGDSVVEMGEAHFPYQPMPTMFYLAWYGRALRAGATSLSKPADQPYGYRNASVEDPFGNVWYIATHIKDVALPGSTFQEWKPMGDVEPPRAAKAEGASKTA
jgi:uncharacterized glyoxalase superfamily protein PhnB